MSLNNSVYVFIGPTIGQEEAATILDAEYMQPVSQGDIISIVRYNPEFIVIIDGFFFQVPSVWHKEILFALSKGINVVGAASMGALRAAELYSFGMVGIGEIFHWYKDGVIESDDEVAISHAPAEYQYKPLSDAMVNIRKTFDKALSKGIITNDIHDRLIMIGRDIPYYNRSYERIISIALESGIPEKVLEDLRLYVAKNRIDQKKTDAVEALKYVRMCLGKLSGPEISFNLARTSYLERLIDHDYILEQKEGIRFTREDFVNYLRLEMDNFDEIRDAAVTNNIICKMARKLGIEVTDEELQAGADSFRQAVGLQSAEDTLRWLEKNHMSDEEFELFIEQSVLINKMKSLLLMEDINRALLNYLRLSGTYEQLFEAAMKRALLLSRCNIEEAALPSREELYQFYFDRKNMPVPDNINDYSQHLGFKDEEAFLAEVKKYYIYWHDSAV